MRNYTRTSNSVKMQYDREHRISKKSTGLKKVVAGVGIVGTLVATTLGILDIKNRSDKRDAYFANLPVEIVNTANDSSAWTMYERVTQGLSKDKRPTFEEFCVSACEMNGISYHTLNANNSNGNTLDGSFGGKFKRLMLPDYDERDNN